MSKPILATDVSPPLSLTASDGTGLRVVSLLARGVIAEPLAFTELHLTFDNPESRVIEGHFDITLPPGATISRFAMRLDSGWQEGEVVELQAARRAYEDFLHRKQDPALMEKQPGNHFRARVFPIPPNGRKELMVAYSQERANAAEPYRIHLRGLPTLEQLDIRVIVSTTEAEPITGRSSALGGTMLSQRTVKLGRTDFTPDADFEVVVPAPASGVQVGLRHENLVVARVLPAAAQKPDPLTDLTVLLDTSASRSLGFGQQLEQLGALLDALREKTPELPLRLCCFDQEVVEIFAGPLSGLSDQVLGRVRERGALGASDLSRALAAVIPAAGSRCTRVLLVSDGIPTAGPTDGSELRGTLQKLRAAGVERLDALVAGGIRDEALLKGLASGGLGRDGIMLDAALPVDELVRRLGDSTLSGVRVTVPGSQWVWPTRLDGLQSGDQVLVYADLPREKSFSVVLEGAAPQPVTLAETERPLLERAWVNARISKLLHQRETLADGDPDLRDALKRQVIELSTKHRVLSDFTALLVLETEDDYRRFGIDRRALSDILTVGPTGIEVLHRKQTATPPRAPLRVEPAAKSEIAAPRDAAPAMDQDDLDVSAPAGDAEEERVSFDGAAPMRELAEASSGSVETVLLSQGMPAPEAAAPPSEVAAAPKRRSTGPGAPDREQRPAAPAAARPAPLRPTPAPSARMAAAEPMPMSMPMPMQPEAAPERLRERESAAVDTARNVAAPAMGRAVALSAPPAAPTTAAASAPAAPSLLNRVVRAIRGESSAEVAPSADAPPPPPPPPPAPSSPPPLGGMTAHRVVAEPPRPQPVVAPTPAVARPVEAPASLPYSGPLLEVMRLLYVGKNKEALDAAERWQRASPGDVLALIALGEALEALGRLSEAARVYGSIVDLFPGRADLRRFAGERLDRLGAAGLALAVDTYRKAREQRPDHPASHRLLGFALLRAGEPAEAFSVLAEGSRRSYPSDRFPGVPRILKEDVGLSAAAWLRSEPAREAEIRGRARDEKAPIPSAASLRFVLNWETDANDVDFHIRDSKGGHAYYGSRSLPSGGELYADVTTGYGPECFTIEGTASAYPYTLQAHYYSRGPMGYGMGKLEIVQHDGKGELRFEQRPFVIMQDRAYIDLGEVKEPL